MQFQPVEIVARYVARQLQARVKAVADLVRGYADDISSAMLDVLDGVLTGSVAAREHRAALEREAEPVFVEGLREGGVDEPELSDEDHAVIAAWIVGQREHVAGFWHSVAALARQRKDMDKEEYNAARRGLYNRVTLWESALRELAGMGKASALANMMCTWRLGKTEKHCQTCSHLNGKRHRLKWFTGQGYIPQQNASETLSCGGWKCDCELLNDKGKRVLPA